MNKISSPSVQHRQNIGEYNNEQNRTCPNQKQQDNFIKNLANRPGLHRDNIQRQNIAQSMIQCLAFLTSIRNCDIRPCITQDTNIQVKNALPSGVKVINIFQETDINGVLTTLTQSASHLLERADRFIAQYDPLRFPTVEATLSSQALGNPILISDFKKPEFLSGKFTKFRNIKAFRPDGKFYDPDIEGPEYAIKYMKVRYRKKNHIIKENKQGEYYLFNPNSKKPWHSEVPVYFDTTDKKVHLGGDIPPNEKLCYEIRNGRCCIKILGGEYVLNYNWHKNTLEVIISNGYLKEHTNPLSGESFLKWYSTTPEYLEIYMEPISKTWHLSEYKGIPAFTDEEKNILNRVGINKDDNYVYIPEQNNNPDIYGTGIIFRAEKKNNYSHHTCGYFIEMNGKLIPIYTKIIPGKKGVYYEIHDDDAHHGKKYSVQYIHSNQGVREESFHYDVRSGKVYPIEHQNDIFLYDNNKWVFK